MTRSILLIAVAAAIVHPHPVAAATCDGLASLSLPNAHVTSAVPVAAGAFTPPLPPGRAGSAAATAAPVPAAGGNAPSPYAGLPAFCRVAATLTPASDSDIKVEVWLPASGWNGKFQAVGNGGWAGTIVYPALAHALARAAMPRRAPTPATPAAPRSSRSAIRRS